MSVVALEMTGGDKLDRHLAGLLDALSSASGVKVGFLEDREYSNGLKVAQVAFWNEFGTIRMPPRPFFRRMIGAKSKNWGKQFASVLKAFGYDAKRAFGYLGKLISEDLRTSINEFSSPALSPRTIARKGFAKPLIDTGEMLRAPDFQVIER